MDIDWDIVLFSETRAASVDQFLDGGHRLIAHLDTELHTGVAILVHRRHCRNRLRVHRISTRLMAIDISFGKSTIRFMAVYLPHAGYALDALERHYVDLTALVHDAYRHRMRVIIGWRF